MSRWGVLPIAASASPGNASGVALTATSLPTTMVSAGTAHTKGAWTELFANSAFNTTLVNLLPGGTAASGQNRHMLCDIGIGPSGSEAVLVPNVAIGCANAARCYTIPIWIPAGSRIAVRYQTAALSLATAIQMTIHNTGNLQSETGTAATAYGLNPAASSGIPLTAPAAINTLGAWTQITASTTSVTRSLLVSIQGPAGSSWTPGASALVDIGYGLSGSEQVLLERIPLSWSTTEMTDGAPITLPVNLPSGTRLVARYQASDIAQQPLISVVGLS